MNVLDIFRKKKNKAPFIFGVSYPYGIGGNAHVSIAAKEGYRMGLVTSVEDGYGLVIHFYVERREKATE